MNRTNWLVGEGSITAYAPIACWDDGERLLPAERAMIAEAGSLRKGELAAGRLLAREALHRLGAPCTEPLLKDLHGCVQWPAGCFGSLSHSKGYLAVTVARMPVGIDLERVGRISMRSFAHVATAPELEAFGQLPEEEQALHAAMVFAAKEAFYKLEFPRTLRRYTFADAEVRWTRDGECHVVAAQTVRNGVWQRVFDEFLLVRLFG